MMQTEQLEMRLLVTAMQGHYGYDFSGYSEESLHRRLKQALARSDAEHFGELQHRVLTSEECFAWLVNQLTVQVSELFRDPQQFRLMRERVVPLLRTYPALKVWHAGCAGGEEVYSDAIVLSEEGLSSRTQVYATDISESALLQARTGVYSKTQLSVARDNYLRAGGTGDLFDHCVSAYDGVAFREALRDNLAFFQHNLVCDYSLGQMHVIFCRNVLIYFQSELSVRVLRMFAKSLCHGGFLFLGQSERLPGELAGSFVALAPGERVYQLRECP